MQDHRLLETFETDKNVFEDLTGCLDLPAASIGQGKNVSQSGKAFVDGGDLQGDGAQFSIELRP